MKFDFPGAVPEIPVEDLGSATDYYRENLGFTVDWVAEDIGLAGVSKGACRIFLADPEFRKSRGIVGPVRIWLNLDSKEAVNELHRVWGESSVRLVSVPESKPWFLHEFTAEDIDGNVFRVFYDFGSSEERA